MIQPLLPNEPCGVPPADDRRVLNGIFRVLRTGTSWRDLPEGWGPRCLRVGGRDAGEALSRRQFGRPRPPTRGGPTGKVHVVVDADGLTVEFVSSAGRVSDKARVEESLDGVPPAHAAAADRGYDAGAILVRSETMARSPIFPPEAIERSGARSIRPFTDSAISSSASSTDSNASARSTHATTNSPETSCPPSLSHPQDQGRVINEATTSTGGRTHGWAMWATGPPISAIIPNARSWSASCLRISQHGLWSERWRR